MIKVTDWGSFQSYKDRKPPWIRLHKSLLDNYEFQMMSAEARALLPMLWLLASEDDDPRSGLIKAEDDKIAFRLRQDVAELAKTINELICHGFITRYMGVTASLQDESKLVTSETETETETETDNIPYWEIVNDLNQKAGTTYKHTTKSTRAAIHARWLEGARLADFQHVHTVKCADWLHDPAMRKHLCPETLYRPSKFEKYLNQKLQTVGSGVGITPESGKYDGIS